MGTNGFKTFYKELGGAFIDNWIDDLGIRCANGWQIGLFGSMFFIGDVVGSVFLSKYGDSHGRVNLIKWSQFVSLITYVTMVYLTTNIYAIYTAIFIIGLFNAWRQNLSYIYGQEIIVEAAQTTSGSCYQFFDSAVMMFSALFIEYISIHWKVLHSVFIALVLASFCIFLFLPESPMFCVEKHEYHRALESYKTIAWVNRSNYDFSEIENKIK
jgi:MFS family permease